MKTIRYIIGSAIELLGIMVLIVAIGIIFLRDFCEGTFCWLERIADSINRAAHRVAGEITFL
ncbi:MAG: hypothetical protein HY096_09650 [Nitrospinae bacterium]|nr:hypothetical protein [Nitrospinota bacterium]